MKLELETEFKNNLSDYLHITLHTPIRKQLYPLDPKNIIWKNLGLPLHIKLYDQIERPIKNQLDNIHI